MTGSHRAVVWAAVAPPSPSSLVTGVPSCRTENTAKTSPARFQGPGAGAPTPSVALSNQPF